MQSQQEDMTSSTAAELYSRTVNRYKEHLSSNPSLRLKEFCMDSHVNFGSHEGAKRAALFYSLACSCKLQKKNFMSYLTDVINKASLIPNGAKASEYRHLLPDMWQESAK